jgi:hypothetical protein
VGDEEREVDQRCTNIPGTRHHIALNLQRFLHQNYLLVNIFRTLLEKMPTDECEVVIRADRRPVGEHERRYNAPTVDEVAVVMFAEEFNNRDIIIERRSENLQRIAETHRSYDALQYPLIFWQGEDGYHFIIMQSDPTTGRPTKKSVCDGFLCAPNNDQRWINK